MFYDRAISSALVTLFFMKAAKAVILKGKEDHTILQNSSSGGHFMQSKIQCLSFKGPQCDI
jgi:hypothetical protein